MKSDTKVDFALIAVMRVAASLVAPLGMGTTIVRVLMWIYGPMRMEKGDSL